jgi:hypothetical protein
VVHVLPTLWFRNIWTWWPDQPKPSLKAASGTKGAGAIVAADTALGDYVLHCEGDARLLFTENETNNERLFGSPNPTPHVDVGCANEGIELFRWEEDPDVRGDRGVWNRPRADRRSDGGDRAVAGTGGFGRLLPVARCFGVALLALGLACWPGPAAGNRWPALRGMLTYNSVIALFLAYLGAVEHVGGLLLWPAVGLHAAVALMLARSWQVLACETQRPDHEDQIVGPQVR